MTKNETNIRHRVRKLLRLAAKDRNNSEAEANAALMKAMELIEAYDLDPTEYGEEHGESVEYDRNRYAVGVLWISKTMIGWRKLLAVSAAMATGCKIVTTRTNSSKLIDALDPSDEESAKLMQTWKDNEAPWCPGRVISMTGTEQDRAVCRAIFEYLCSACDRLAKSHVRKVSQLKKEGYHVSPRREGNDYRCSYADGVMNQVEDKRRKQRGARSTSALMVLERDEEHVSKATDDIWGRLLAGSRISYRHNQGAYGKGSSAYLGRNTMGSNGGGSTRCIGS